MSIWKWVALGATGITVFAAGGWWWFTRVRIETPKYEVTKIYGEMEIRRYAPRVVAEVEIEGELDEASNQGFRALAGYIFGDNRRRDEIAMTAPVEVEPQKIAMTAPVDMKGDGGRWTMAFTMPSKYTLDTLPTPNDERVRIREAPATQYFVYCFSGNPSGTEVDAIEARVRAAAAHHGIPLIGQAVYARYDPPTTPGFLRRNEVLIEITGQTAAAHTGAPSTTR